jgi:hypothetical protein
LRHRRNRRGLRVVHARKIERMLHRSWRKKFGLPAALTPKLGKERGP